MLLETVGHCIPYIPFQDHHLNICMKNSCVANLIVAKLFNTFETLYVCFTYGTIRSKYLESILAGIKGSLKLRNLSKTRGTARTEPIKAARTSFKRILYI